MSDGLRIDKWLWHARFFKTRTLSVAAVKAGAVRIDGARISKPAHVVRIGDALTIVQGERSRVVRVAGFGVRRGPAPEAQALYEDLTPPPAPDSEPNELLAPRAGPRPDKRGRRAISALKTDFTDG